jgi:protein arginine kinase activator
MIEKPEENEQSDEEKLPERPLECCECKRNIAVVYTEIVGKSVTRTSMCADCPFLHKHLHGSLHGGAALKKGQSTLEPVTGLACGNCGTTLESVRVGIPLGCSVCYEVFDDALLTEIIASEKIPSRLTVKKGAPAHIGRGPGQSQEMNPSLRLLALNEALTETLKKEDYEQAAWLRDQIKALTDNHKGAGPGK